MTRPPRKSPAGRGGAGDRPDENATQGELPFDADPDDAPKPSPRVSAPRTSAPANTRSKAASKTASKPAAPKRSTKAKPASGKPKKAAAKPARTAGKNEGKGEGKGPTGFGGWLWLLAIGQLLVTARLIDTLRRMTALVGTELWTDHPKLVAADLGLYGFALLLQLLVIGAMVMRSRFFRPLFLVAIIAFFLIGRIEPLLAITVLGMDPKALLSQASLVPLAIELAVSLVWGAYVVKSRRVTNTFVR